MSNKVKLLLKKLRGVDMFLSNLLEGEVGFKQKPFSNNRTAFVVVNAIVVSNPLDVIPYNLLNFVQTNGKYIY